MFKRTLKELKDVADLISSGRVFQLQALISKVSYRLIILVKYLLAPVPRLHEVQSERTLMIQ